MYIVYVLCLLYIRKVLYLTYTPFMIYCMQLFVEFLIVSANLLSIAIQMPCHISESSIVTTSPPQDGLVGKSSRKITILWEATAWVRSLQLWPCSGFLDFCRTFWAILPKKRGAGGARSSHREHIPNLIYDLIYEPSRPKIMNYIQLDVSFQF